MTEAQRPPAAVIAAGGVYLPGHLAEPVWRVLRDELLRRRRDGLRVRPEVAQALDTLRAAALDYLSTSANGHDPRTPTDIETHSPVSELVSTTELAARLDVSERHARRVAHTEGIKPAARGLWTREDVEALAARRGA